MNRWLISGSLQYSTLRSVFSNKNMTFLLSVSDCWCRRWLSTWVWITRLGGLVRASVRRWWWWWWRHNCRHKKAKISEEKFGLAPPVVKKRRFPCAIGSLKLVYNPNTLLMRWPKSLKTRNKMVEMLWTCWLYDAKSLINIEKCCKWRKKVPESHKKNKKGNSI